MWKANRPSLVLVALDIHDRRLFGVVEKIRQSDMLQSVRALRPRLCALYVDGNIVRRAMHSDDVLAAADARGIPSSRIGPV